MSSDVLQMTLRRQTFQTHWLVETFSCPKREICDGFWGIVLWGYCTRHYAAVMSTI